MSDLVIAWNRNQEGTTAKYHIYESSELPIEKYGVKTLEVQQPLAVNLISHHEVVRPNEAGVFQLSYRYISDYSVVSDKLVIPKDNISMNNEEGVFVIKDNTPSEVIVNYDYDGVSITRSDGFKSTTGTRKILASPAVDRTSDIITGTVEIQVKHGSTLERNLYYGIKAVDYYGNESAMSAPFVYRDSETAKSSVIESSYDKIDWVERATVTDEAWQDTEAICPPPNPVTDLSIEKTDTSNTLSWTLSKKEQPLATSPTYRVRSILDDNTISQWSYLKPIEVGASPKFIVIKRSVGSIAPTARTYGEEVARLDYASTEYVDTFTTQEEYTYSVYVVDEKDNYSVAQIIS